MSKVESQLAAAREASLQGRHQQAVDLCVAVLQGKPGDPTAIAFLALSLWRGADFRQAVDVLRRALQHFPAQAELSLALLESLQALGEEEQALRFAATLPEALLAQPPFVARVQALRNRAAAAGPGVDVERRLMLRHNDGAFAQVAEELEPLLKIHPDWGAGHMLAASLLFNRSGLGIPAQALQVPENCDAASIQAVWRTRLAQAMSSHRACILAHLKVALAASPEDPRALLIRARTRFEDGAKLDDAELAFVGAQSGCLLLGPFPLHPALAHHPRGRVAVNLLQSAAATWVPEPRHVGASLDLACAVGAVLSSDRYVGEARDATVAAGSEVVLLNDGSALCEPLTHALGELTHYLSDGWIALGSVRQLMLRERPAIVVEGTAISLLGAAARFYGHWLLDYLLRLRSTYQHPDAAEACVLVEDGMPESHYEALRLLHGAEADIRRVAPGHCVRVERLLFSGAEVFFPHFARVGAPTSPSVAPTSAQGLAFLRDRMLAALGEPQRRGGRIFVRRRSTTRRVLNEDELCDMLIREWGFESLEPNALGFADQVRRFHDADVVVGAQGSAMSNCVFCAPGTRIVALCPPFAANFPSWADALERIGLQHCFAVGSAVESSHELPVQRDFLVDAGALRLALADLGVTPS